MSEFIIVTRAISGNRMAIRKKDVITFYQDEIEVEGNTKKCVKVELQNQENDWVKVSTKFGIVLNQFKEEN